MDISAVIPTYNHAQYVGDAIESVLNQSRPVQEVIVVDDGSTDDTRQVVAGFGSRVRYIYQPNRGLSAARNAGIQAARHPWIALLDADDWWLPDKILRQVEALDRDPGAVLVYASLWYCLPDGSREPGIALPPEIVQANLWRVNWVMGSGSAALVRRDAILAEGGFNESLSASEDWDMWARLSFHHRFIRVTEPVVAIRVIPSSMSRSPERMWKNCEQVIDTTLLRGRSGLDRWLRRRRSRSACAFMVARSPYVEREQRRAYTLRALREWPLAALKYEHLALILHNLLSERNFRRLRGWFSRSGASSRPSGVA